ncbi:MAG: hypothetical protein ISP86_03645 [Shewanellaceae bacterium]|nr:hypothetical protein [Shewanellaceae bacterium]
MQYIIRLALALLISISAPVHANHHDDHQLQKEVKSNLIPVASARVCMVNNRVFEQDQIPIQVQGKTYYGCCNMCKDKLNSDVSARQGLDPITHSPVDKATAVIAADATGKVFYFENEQHLKQYNQNL